MPESPPVREAESAYRREPDPGCDGPGIRTSAEDTVDLPPVHEIVGSHQLELMSHTLRPSLAVQPHSLQLSRTELVKEMEVAPSHAAKLRESHIERFLPIAELANPGVLVVTLQFGPGLGQN